MGRKIHIENTPVFHFFFMKVGHPEKQTQRQCLIEE